MATTEATTVSVIVGIRADSTPHATAVAGGRIYVAADSSGVGLTGKPEDVLAFARALLVEVERNVPVDLLMDEWAAEEAVQT